MIKIDDLNARFKFTRRIRFITIRNIISIIVCVRGIMQNIRNISASSSSFRGQVKNRTSLHPVVTINKRGRNFIILYAHIFSNDALCRYERFTVLCVLKINHEISRDNLCFNDRLDLHYRSHVV